MRASANIEPARIGLARLVDCEYWEQNGPLRECTYHNPVTQVGYNVMLAMYNRLISTSHYAGEINP